MAKDVEKKPKKEKKHFFKDFKAELKKVIWPTPKQVVNNTIAVITIVLITAVIVFALDLVFKAINTYGINGIKQIVQGETNTVENEANTSETSETTNTEDSNSVLVQPIELNTTSEETEATSEVTNTAEVQESENVTE